MPHITSGEMSQDRHNADRIRRAYSWLERSERARREREKAGPKADTGLACEQFMFLWVAFNAAYGRQLIDEDAEKERGSESDRFIRFLREIVERDEAGIIENVLWKKFSGPVRNLVENMYVFEPFWEWVRGSARGEKWEERFNTRKRQALHCLHHMTRNRGTVVILLDIVFRQLYALRNQAFHGGMTFATGWGRDGSNIMAALVPAILDIMRADIEKNPDSGVWGKVAYPRINDSKDRPPAS